MVRDVDVIVIRDVVNCTKISYLRIYIYYGLIMVTTIPVTITATITIASVQLLPSLIQ